MNAKAFGGRDGNLLKVLVVYWGVRCGTAVGMWVVCGLLVLEAALVQAEPTCVTEGILDGDELTLLLDRGDPFAVRLRNRAKARVTFSDGSPPQVDVVAPEVTVGGPGRVAHHLRAGASFIQDMLFINETVRFSDLRYENGVIATNVPLDAGLMVKNVRIPCDALRAGGPTETHVARRRLEAATLGMARARRNRLVLYREPKAEPAVHIELAPASVTFEVLARQAGWVKISWDGDAGDLRGWTPSTEVRIVKSISVMASSSIGCCAAHPLAKNATRRTGRLQRGSSIYASPDGTRWAIVQVDVDGVEIEDIPDNEWLRILKNPPVEEISCDPTRSWVRWSAVQFAEGTTLRTSGGAAEPGVAALNAKAFGGRGH